jgi:hypothetical protein
LLACACCLGFCGKPPNLANGTQNQCALRAFPPFLAQADAAALGQRSHLGVFFYFGFKFI